MIWSKVKKNVENKFTPKLKGRIQLYITTYGDKNASELFNRGWITIDGAEVVNFSTPDFFYLNKVCYHYSTPTFCATSEQQKRNQTKRK